MILFTIIKKEIIDTLRDRKTLFSAILLPAISLPLILYVTMNIQNNVTTKEANKTLKIVLIDAPVTFQDNLLGEKLKVVDSLNLSQAKKGIENDEIDAALLFELNFENKIDSLENVSVEFYFKSTNNQAKKRLRKLLSSYTSTLKSERLKELNVNEQLINPVAVNEINIATKQEQLGDVIGGSIPYLFILFCFVGCMYPALDLITGEKERGTIETLLTVPASRFSILLGKTITIALVGIVAALMTLAGLFVGLNFMEEIPAAFMNSINDMFNIQFVLSLLCMLVPLSLFFGGLLSAVVVRASSYKEAQSYVTPMSFVVIIPAMIAMMPGVELTWITACIPIANVALGTKEIVAGTINYGLYAGIVFSLLFFALVSVYASYKSFSDEGNLLK